MAPPARRGRPPKVRTEADFQPNHNDTGEAVEDKNLMSVEQASHLSKKNARTMVKLMQLIEVMKRPGAADMDVNREVESKIEKYKKRINRRLRKLAEWSDEKVEHRRLYQTDRRKRYESSHKQVYSVQPFMKVVSSVSVLPTALDGTTPIPAKQTVVSYGSVTNYAAEYNSMLHSHGVPGAAKQSLPQGSHSTGTNGQVAFRVTEYAAQPGQPPAVRPNDAFGQLKRGRDVDEIRVNKNPYLYLTARQQSSAAREGEGGGGLSAEAIMKRKKLDDAHIVAMATRVRELAGQK